MKPWERRLKDLAHVISNCANNYLEPDLFRMNTNHFLQTSRTVTFIIQKNKASIPNFSHWYQSNVLNPWSTDKVMTWAKDSRNTIEKKGDLELFSSLSATLIFSYLEEQDMRIELDHRALGLGVNKLARFASKNLPAGISENAVIKIERKWVTSSLNTHELLHALTYVYARIFECCSTLGIYLDDPIDPSIPTPSNIDFTRQQATYADYINPINFEKFSMKTGKHRLPKNHKPPADIAESANKLHQEFPSLNNIDDAINKHSRMAEQAFIKQGEYLPMVFLFDENWKTVDMIAVHLADQTQKYIFWRIVSDKIRSLNISSVIFASELWIRRTPIHAYQSMRKMPIIGEQLQVVAFDKENNRRSISWDIIRDNNDSPPTLAPSTRKQSMLIDGQPFVFVPAMRAMGIPDEDILPDLNQHNTPHKEGTKAGTEK